MLSRPDSTREFAMYTNHVTIGPEFFAKAFNDYANWRWAIVREFMQNSMDCRSRVIRVSVMSSGGDTQLIVANDGESMTSDIITQKLLALGGSGKNFTGAVGGFGKAKEILYFAHKSYEIMSGSVRVHGSGAGYNLDTIDPVVGTLSTVVIAGDHVERLTEVFRLFAGFAQWDGEFYLNDKLVLTNLRKGSQRRDLGFGTVYTNKSFSNVLVVRMGGIPMFTEVIGLNRCVIVELCGSSVDCLTSNRDGLVFKYRSVLSGFLTELTVDKRSALRNRGARYKHYRGARFSHRVSSGLDVQNLVAEKPKVVPASGDVVVPASGGVVETGVHASGTSFDSPVSVAMLVGSVSVQSEVVSSGFGSVQGTPAVSSVSISQEFIVKNETDMKIPDYYLPESDQFSTYSAKLARIWGRLVIQLHRLFEHEAEFAIGFIFDDETVAEFEDSRYGKVYYLNPACVVTQDCSASKSFKKRFKLTDRNQLLSIAVHEFVHGVGHGMHDEVYAGKFTDMMAKVMDNRSMFNSCFA